MLRQFVSFTVGLVGSATGPGGFMSDQGLPPLKLPTLDAVPGEDASLRDYGRFIDDFFPSKHFVARWGDDYKSKVAALHRRVLERYEAGQEPPEEPLDELMMFLAYQWVTAPYLGLPESQMLALLRWVVEGIRRQLGDTGK